MQATARAVAPRRHAPPELERRSRNESGSVGTEDAANFTVIGLALFGAAAATVWLNDRRQGEHAHAHGDHDDDDGGHAHSHGKSATPKAKL